MYNEEDTIIWVLAELKKLSLPQFEIEIIVINDGSTDLSGPFVEQFIQYKKLETDYRKKQLDQ